MRKIFGGAMLFSVIGAVVLGGSLAWTSTQQTPVATNTVGALAFAINYTSNNNLLGPDGSTVEVGDGSIDTTGSQFNLGWKDGSLIVTSVLPGQGQCSAGNFVGTVLPNGDLALSREAPLGTGQGIAPNTNPANGFTAEIEITAGAPAGCQGAVVSYVISITMVTTPS